MQWSGYIGTHNIKQTVFLKKWANPGFFFNLFSSFQTHITIFTTNKCEKCPYSTHCLDSDSRPLEHESPPINTLDMLLTLGKIIFISAFLDWAHLTISLACWNWSLRIIRSVTSLSRQHSMEDSILASRLYKMMLYGTLSMVLTYLQMNNFFDNDI